MRICHVGIMGDIEKEGMITQYIYKYCKGEHVYAYIKGKIPEADIYILHCMKNLLYLEDFIGFYKFGKIISLIHSSEPCWPSKFSDKIIVLTKYWQMRLNKLYDIDSIVIPGGIDLKLYAARKEQEKLAFGKITRAESGKFHSNWNNIIFDLLEKNINTECRIICNNYKILNFLEHSRMHWIESVSIGEHHKKIRELAKLSIYIEAHNDSGHAFVDTFNISMLEAMALGIPVVILKGLQEPMCEVLGDYKYIAKDITEFKEMVNFLLRNKKQREIAGEQVRKRAECFSYEKMVEEWDNVIYNQLC